MSDPIIQIDIAAEPTTKAGKRNSAADTALLGQLRDVLQQANVVLAKLGLDADTPAEQKVESDGEAEAVKTAPAAEAIPAAAPLAAEAEADPSMIKSLGDGRLGHYGIVWGSKKQRDLYGEWFDRDTAEMDVIFKAIGKVPLLYHHAMDGSLKTSVVGVVEKMVVDDVGLWLESQLNMANAYASAITGLVQKRALGTSTGTLPGGRDSDKSTGKITRWPIVEASLTPTPAEPRMRQNMAVSVLKSYFIEAGLTPPAQFDQDTGAEEARSGELELERERLSLLSLIV